MRRIKDDWLWAKVKLPFSTGSPPDKPGLASSIPYAPFECGNIEHGGFTLFDMEPPSGYGHVEYLPVNWESY